MPDASDIALMREYADHNSEAAFAELVQRHINLAYSVALRFTGNSSDAQDVVQAVFIILAKKAAHLRAGTVLTGWVYETTRLTALQSLRSRARRHQHEQEAHMQSTVENPETEDIWPQMVPLLEEAMSRLNEKERTLLALRYFENRTSAESAVALGIGEWAAHKRSARALEKLRKHFSRRGVNSTTATIAGAISAHSIQAAPAALAKSVAGIAITKGALAGGSAFTLAHGAMKMMTWAKLKLTCGIGTAILLSSGVAALVATEMADSGDRYQIDGTLVYDGSFTRDFTLVVNGSNWMIHLADPTKGPTDQYEEEVCLNGSVYSYSHVGSPDPTGHVVNNAIANIDYGQSAVSDTIIFAQFAWVGLASGTYFSSRTNDQVTPMFEVSNARDYRVKAEWQLYDSPPHLPKSIDYYMNSGQQLYGHHAGEIAHPFDNGWKEGEVRVLQETNLDGKTFPLAYQYEQFRPKLDEPILTNAVDHQFSVTVNVKSIRLDSVPDVLPPKADGGTMLEENRFPKIKGRNPAIGYLSKATRLPENPEPEAVQEYKFQTEPRKRTTRAQQVVPIPPPSHKWIWLSGSLAVLIVAQTVLFIRRKRAH